MEIGNINQRKKRAVSSNVKYYSTIPTKVVFFISNPNSIKTTTQETTKFTTTIANTTKNYIDSTENSYTSDNKLADWVIAVIVISILFLVLAIILSVFYIRFRKIINQFLTSKKKEYIKRSTSAVEAEKRYSINTETNNTNNFSFNLLNITKVCKTKHMNNDYLFKEEFLRIPEFLFTKTTKESDKER